MFMFISLTKQYLSEHTPHFINNLFLKCLCLFHEPEFYVESRGSLRCAMGKAIMDKQTCKEACRALNAPQIQILGNNLCYKDFQGNCYQNGRNGAGASLICKKDGKH